MGILSNYEFKIPSKLILLETDTSFRVAWAQDEDDWVVEFLKKPNFPARQWAERMVDLYNEGRQGPAPLNVTQT
jgi:hypothetical protein